VEDSAELARASREESLRTEIGDETYSEADAWTMGRTAVIDDSPMLKPDSRVRRERNPLAPAGIDFQENAPPPKEKRPKKKRTNDAP
jgi:hypothetical protein